MATQIDLCNRALTRCGALRIMDLSENTKPARAIAAVYNQVRDSCLSIANWRFAMKRITLEVTTAQDGYQYAYILPSTTLRLVKIRDRYIGFPSLGPRYISDPLEEFVLETDRRLLTIYGPPMNVLGVQRIEDTSLHDPLFNDWFTLAMAIEVWEDVSRKGATKLQVILAERDRALSIARANNAIMEAPLEVDDTAWILGRQGP